MKLCVLAGCALLLLPACKHARSVQVQPPVMAAGGRFGKFQKAFRSLADSGHLDAAESVLQEAEIGGLDQATYQRCANELDERRTEAIHLIRQGDDLLSEERYKEARLRYENAGRIDRDNSLVAGKIAMAERFRREARSRNIRAVVGFAIPVAGQALSDYIEFKREEERLKREEEERKREEAERAAAEARERERRQARERERDRHDSPPPPPPRPRPRRSREPIPDE